VILNLPSKNDNEIDSGFYYDPCYGYIPLSPLIRRAIDLKPVQRLRRVRQLSTLYLIFPGAMHSRFEHSIGVYHLASTVYDRLERIKTLDSEIAKEWPEPHPLHKIALQLAAIFHDIGHGPFSHTFEMFVKRNPSFENYSHTQTTQDLIIKGIGEFNDIPIFLRDLIEKEEKIFGSDARKILAPENIAKIATGDFPTIGSQYLYLSKIIDGPFDVDRMDYLRRDSIHMGIETGRVDIWEIIHNYLLVKGWDNKEETPDSWVVNISKSVADSVEALLTTRDLVYRKVYYNKWHRFNEELIIRAMEEISSKLTNEELVVKTDEEVLDLFSNPKYCSRFTKQVALRIKERKLYTVLPYELQLWDNLNKSTRANIPSYKKEKYDELRELENNSSKKLKINPDDLFIIDLEETPIAKKKDYTYPYIWDEKDNKRISLKDASPHLKLLYENKSEEEQPIDAYEQYVKRISKIKFALPPEYFTKVVNTINTNKTKYNHKDIEDNLIICPEYQALLKAMESFFKMIGIEEPENESKIKDFEFEIKKYFMNNHF